MKLLFLLFLCFPAFASAQHFVGRWHCSEELGENVHTSQIEVGAGGLYKSRFDMALSEPAKGRAIFDILAWWDLKADQLFLIPRRVEYVSFEIGGKDMLATPMAERLRLRILKPKGPYQVVHKTTSQIDILTGYSTVKCNRPERPELDG